MRRPISPVYFLVVVVVLVSSLTSALPASAATQTFSNSTIITIPASGTNGAADLYPSSINVTGMIGVITDVNVTLWNINHTYPDDIDVLLVGPAGQKVLLMTDAGCTDNISGVNLTFDQSAGASLPDTSGIVTGTYLPSNYDMRCTVVVVDDGFLSPAPPATADFPYETSLNVFNGTDPNGTWSLYVVDDAGGDTGSIAGGWSLEITTAAAPIITSPAAAAGVVGTPFSHTFTATGDPVPTLTYTNENLPPGVTRTGDTLSGTPTAVGTYTIDVTASNGVSPDAFQTFTLTVTETFVPPPPAPPPPPVPTCNEVGNESSAVVRAQAADGTVTDGAVFCRVLVENGSFKGDPGQVGNLTLIQWGISQAVEVFALTEGGHPVVPFSQPVYVCLRGTGTLYYADASNAPRSYSEIASVEQDGFTCASIPNAGTLVLVNGGA